MTDGRSASDVRLDHLERDLAKLEQDFKDYRERTDAKIAEHEEKNAREIKALAKFQTWLMGIAAGAFPLTEILLKKLGIIP